MLRALLFFPVLLLAEPAGGVEVRVMPEQPSQGELVVIELSQVATGTQARGTFNDAPLLFFTDDHGRMRALAAVGLQQAPGNLPLLLTVTSPGSAPIEVQQSVVVREGSFGSQQVTVDPKYIKPPKKVAARIKREDALLGKIYRSEPTERQWRADFVRPSDARVRSGFGLRRMFNGVMKSRHLGLDIDVDLGEPVRAINDGTVVMAMNLYYTGGTVIIDHGLKLYSLYFHLSKFEVAVGQKVAQGHVIARGGATGRATGPHLHLATRVGQILFDPETLLRFNFGEQEKTAEEPAAGPATATP
jgi:murein DD-endopeptidase MepM/ murein hydrolase activator NlpD